MNFLKHFFIFLSIWITFALYWAYYVSNIADLKYNTKVWTWVILKEQQLFAKYNINPDLKNPNSDKIWSENSKYYEIFKKEAPELKIVRSNTDENKNFNPQDKIVISFWEEINIYSLLWFKKVINWEYTCDWKTLKSDKKAIRCDSENKIFITKIWEDWKTEKEKIFKWVVKKSKIDKKTIIINTKIEKFQDYQLKILKWVKSFKIDTLTDPDNILYSELKKDVIFNFTTTDENWNSKPEKVEKQNTWTWEITEENNVSWTWVNKNDNTSWSWEIIKNTDQKDTVDWLKQKQSEIWVQKIYTESWSTSKWETN